MIENKILNLLNAEGMALLYHSFGVLVYVANILL